jgi:hypothetical protein
LPMKRILLIGFNYRIRHVFYVKKHFFGVLAALFFNRTSMDIVLHDKMHYLCISKRMAITFIDKQRTLYRKE